MFLIEWRHKYISIFKKGKFYTFVAVQITDEGERD